MEFSPEKWKAKRASSTTRRTKKSVITPRSRCLFPAESATSETETQVAPVAAAARGRRQHLQTSPSHQPPASISSRSLPAEHGIDHAGETGWRRSGSTLPPFGPLHSLTGVVNSDELGHASEGYLL